MFGCGCCSISSIIWWIGFAVVAKKLFPIIKKKVLGNKPRELEVKDYKKDVVYLFQFPGTPTASSLSPFCIKIEAFCRLHEIKFERRNTFASRGQNNLLPFIELNGEIHSDSQMILRRLTQIFKLKNYPDEQTAAVGHAVDRMLDNHTFNTLLYAKIPVLGQIVNYMARQKVPSIILPVVSCAGAWFGAKKMGQRAAGSIGKFSEAEANELLKNDLTQLQTILGSKKFLVAEEPTLVDCTALGQFGSAYYAVPSAKNYIHVLLEDNEFASLKAYLERTKERLYGNDFRDN